MRKVYPIGMSRLYPFGVPKYKTPQERDKAKHERYMGRVNADPERLKAHKERKRATRRRYRDKHPEQEKVRERKAYIRKKFGGMSVEEYERRTEECDICGFRGAIDLHHKNGKGDNKNFVALCKNHHWMFHSLKKSLEELKKEHDVDPTRY